MPGVMQHFVDVGSLWGEYLQSLFHRHTQNYNFAHMWFTHKHTHAQSKNTIITAIVSQSTNIAKSHEAYYIIKCGSMLPFLSQLRSKGCF